MLQLILWNGQKIWTKKIWIYKKFDKKKIWKKIFFWVRTYVKPNVVFSKIPFTPGGGGGVFYIRSKMNSKKISILGGVFYIGSKMNSKKITIFWGGVPISPKWKTHLTSMKSWQQMTLMYTELQLYS